MSGTHGFIATLRVAGGEIVQTEHPKKAKCYKEGMTAYRAGDIQCPYHGGFFSSAYARFWKFGWDYAQERAGKKK